jgi:hypothetical protein
MGQQYVESIGLYAKKVYKEYPSELQCYRPEEISKELLDMVFNTQYGIWYYEPASKEESDKMIDCFEEKIKELKEKYASVT